MPHLPYPSSKAQKRIRKHARKSVLGADQRLAFRKKVSIDKIDEGLEWGLSHRVAARTALRSLRLPTSENRKAIQILERIDAYRKHHMSRKDRTPYKGKNEVELMDELTEVMGFSRMLEFLRLESQYKEYIQELIWKRKYR